MTCWQRAWHGRAGQEQGGNHGGSDASSLTDDGMTKGQTGPHPRPAGCQAWPLAGPAGCFNLCQRPLQMRCCYFQLPYRWRVGTGFPSDRAARQRSEPATTKKLGCLSPRDPEDQNVSHIGRAPRDLRWSALQRRPRQITIAMGSRAKAGGGSETHAILHRVMQLRSTVPGS